jgi:hypothetical protein
VDDATMARLRSVARGLAFVFGGVALLVLVGSAMLVTATVYAGFREPVSAAPENPPPAPHVEPPGPEAGGGQPEQPAPPPPVTPPAPPPSAPRGPLLPPAVELGFVIAAWVAILLHLIGQLLCLRVPPEAEARTALAVAIGLNVLAKGLSLGELVLVSTNTWHPPAPLLSLSNLGLLCSVVSSLFFLRFLQRLARYLSDGDAELRAEEVLFLWVTCIVLFLLMTGVLLMMLWSLMADNVWAVVNNPGIVAVMFLVIFFPLALLTLVLELVAFIKYCNLLTGLRETILRRVEKAALEQRPKKAGLTPT